MRQLDDGGTEDGLLVARWLRTRSETDFRALYGRCTPAAYGLALRLTRGDESVSHEIVQEAWVRALGRLSSFDRARPLRPWLGGFVVNCWREYARRIAAESGEPIVAGDGADARYALAEFIAERLDLRRAVDRLAPGYREVLLLHDVEGYTHEEIAALLGVSAGTSKSQLSRARGALREMLRDDRDSAPTADSERTVDHAP